MKSVMSHDFGVAPSIDAPRSVFDRSCGYKTTFDSGYLIPFLVDDVLPGDTFNVNVNAFARLATPIYPIMDNMYMDFHFFFVPDRLTWNNARKFYGEQANPADTIDYTLPQFTAFTVTAGSLHDYMGIPPLPGQTIAFNSQYARGYNLVWNEWFRDQNLQDSVVVDLDDGPDLNTDYVLLKRGKRHDYFTSALPWPQKGDAINLPIGTTAPIVGLGIDSTAATALNGNRTVRETDGSPATETYTDGNYWRADTALNLLVEESATAGYPAIYADLSSATASTINDIREAFQVQKLLERDARGGTRYSELVRNHFGVNFYDVSYRPEFLGGGSVPVNVSPVATTTDGTRDVGDLGAMGTAHGNTGFTKSFVEHGFILGLVSVRADLTYQQGVDRKFIKQTRYDKYWPSLAHLGEQEITNKEIYYTNTASDDLVFGYQERYAEYRYKPSQITGQFRSAHATPLDAWHLSQEFATLPLLDDTFIQETPPIGRVVQVPSEPEFIFDSYISMKCARPMPVYGIPGMIDHF